MRLRTLADAPITEGTRILLRAGLNVPVDGSGNPTDEYRLRRALATIEYLAERKARTVIAAHLGREGGSLRPVAAALQKLTGKTVIRFFDGALSAAAAQDIAPGECLLLENIRREAGEEKNDPNLSAALARLGEIYVDDAFADSHRAHASVVGVAGLLPAYAGILMEEEVAHLSEALKPPPGSVAIVGGAKFETKEPLITKLLSLYARVCVGGALANDFLKARGVNVAASAVSSLPVPPELAQNARIALPVDGRFIDGGASRTAPLGAIAASERILDAGPATVSAWNEFISSAPLVLWNGPLGVYEQGFVESTDALAKAIAEHCEEKNARAIVGGGDTIAALENIPFDAQKIFRSTGGGAMLQFLADGTLPGLEPLKA